MTLARALRQLGVDPATTDLIRDDRKECWTLVRREAETATPVLVFPESPRGRILAHELAETIRAARATQEIALPLV